MSMSKPIGQMQGWTSVMFKLTVWIVPFATALAVSWVIRVEQHMNEVDVFVGQGKRWTESMDAAEMAKLKDEIKEWHRVDLERRLHQ